MNKPVKSTASINDPPPLLRKSINKASIPSFLNSTKNLRTSAEVDLKPASLLRAPSKSR